MAAVGVRVKVCGLTSVADALASAAAGADWVGLNFHPASPRRVDLSIAAEIVAALPGEAAPVGLFVNRPPADVNRVAEQLGLSIVQLHGDEPPEDLVALKHLTIVRAFRLHDASSVAKMEAYLLRCEQLGRPPDAVLIDAHVIGMAGGTGTQIPADVLSRLPRVPRLVLAGGLNPENVAERVLTVRPWMVDVASGVESSPGRKDPDRVAAFIRAARGA